MITLPQNLLLPMPDVWDVEFVVDTIANPAIMKHSEVRDFGKRLQMYKDHSVVILAKRENVE